MSSIRANFQEIEKNLKDKQVKIIAVTKYYDETKIIEAYEQGLRDFAENKVKDALDKLTKLPGEIVKNSTWHFIGHLQTNKVKKVVGKFDYIHSVDSLKLAKSISEFAHKHNSEQKVLLQVNNADEEAKYGFSPEELKVVFQEIIDLKSLKVVGIMNMAPYTDNEEELSKLFKGIRDLRDYLEEKHQCKLHELSMGMSNDYKVAIKEGSTMIRIGSKLFR